MYDPKKNGAVRMGTAEEIKSGTTTQEGCYVGASGEIFEYINKEKKQCRNGMFWGQGICG